MAINREFRDHLRKNSLVKHNENLFCLWYFFRKIVKDGGFLFVLSELCDNLFEILVSFAESTKRKAAVWPLQIMLLMLSPVSTAGQRSKT